MKKMFVILAAMFAASVAHATFTGGICAGKDPCDPTGANGKLWLCHKTDSSTNPYDLIHPNQNGLNGHTAHPAVDVCATLIGACNTEASGINKYRDIVFSCPTVPGTPTTFSLDCSGGACQTKLSNSASFDFNVASGGINSDLYVCKVGFRANDCPSCNAKDDKIVVKLKDGTLVTIPYGTPGPGFQLFGLENPALMADVYLNSLDFSAGWYVQYCLKTTRLVVGTGSVTSSLAAKITANLEVNATNDNGYLDKAVVKFGVTHACANVAETPLSFLQDNEAFGPVDFLEDYISPLTSAFINSQDTLCLNGVGCKQQACVWTVHFQETSCQVRKIKNVDCTKNPIECTPYNSSLHTLLDVDTELTCPVGGCV